MKHLKNIELQKENAKLTRLLNTSRTALLAVSAGIWRNKKDNTCGMASGAVAVHLVEDALNKMNQYIETGDFKE